MRGFRQQQEKARQYWFVGRKGITCRIKLYFEPNPDFHEVKLNGFVADICNAEGIIEIQTRNLGKLKRKLEVFLEQMPVTIVYPIARTKYLCWVDEETGDVTGRRKSPKTGSAWDLFRELYQLRSFLTHPNFCVCAALIDLEEYRLLNGWSRDKKRGSTRYDRIPIQLVELVYLMTAEDYRAIVPNTLPKKFTSKDFSKAVHISLSSSPTSIADFVSVGRSTACGKTKECIYL